VNTNEFIEKSKEVHGNKYDYSLVKYKKSRILVEIICPEHGIFKQKPESHLGGVGCIKCNRKIKFIENSKKIHGNKYDYSLVDYKDQYTKIDIICPEHGIFKQIPKNHLRGNGCKKCMDDKKRFNIKDFIKKSKKIHGNKYDYSLVDYEGSHKYVKILCPEHGEFKQKPYIHLQGKGCRLCDNKRKSLLYRSNTNEFIEKSKEIHGNKYDYSLVEYIDSNCPVKIICPEHGIFEQKPSLHLSGRGCKYCKSSKGELKIMEILESNNIDYIKEKRFKNCRDVIPLPFDFYLPKYNLCIEYDGIHHFKPIYSWNGKNGLKYIKSHDVIKNDFCDKNKINLLRIKCYDNDGLDKILDFIKK
jgi:hypothetical protein